MKIYFTIILSMLLVNVASAQPTKVAILDFENTSGKTEYDALGKAISSMLITDLANNIHPKKVEFFERSQLNKLLDEQNLQKSKNFDAKTAVDFGKLSGVNYVFVGSVFVLDGVCNFSSKLVDVRTSQIIMAKDVSGKIETWLQMKTQLAEGIALQLNNPITLEPSYKDEVTTLVTINQYGKILNTIDQGDAIKADELRILFQETNPEFKYYNDIKEDIDELKKQVAKNTEDIEILNESGGRVINANDPREIVMNLLHPLTKFDDACKMVIDLLKFDLKAVNEGFFGSFAGFMPPGRIDEYDVVRKDDNLSVISKDISFLSSCLNVPNLNPETTSHYVFKCFITYAYMFSQNKTKFKDQIEQLNSLGESLKIYNSNKNISSYQYQYVITDAFIDDKGLILLPFADYRELNDDDLDISAYLRLLIE
jgi:TolB-like protein